MNHRTEQSIWRLIAFSSPGLPLAALGLPIGMFLPQYYAGPGGLGLATVGSVFLIARLWDVFTDPLFGFLSDRLVSRWGRRRHWIVLSLPLLMIASYRLFVPSAAVSASYLLGWLLVLYVGWTMLSVSHLAWAAELSRDHHGRTRIQAFREAGETLGIPLVLLIPAVIESRGVVDLETARVAAIGWFLVVLLPVAGLLCVGLVDEPPIAARPRVPLRHGLSLLLHNASLGRLLAADFLGGLTGSALGALFAYQVTHGWKMGHATSLLMLLYFFAGLGFIR